MPINKPAIFGVKHKVFLVKPGGGLLRSTITSHHDEPSYHRGCGSVLDPHWTHVIARTLERLVVKTVFVTDVHDLSLSSLEIITLTKCGIHRDGVVYALKKKYIQ